MNKVLDSKYKGQVVIGKDYFMQSRMLFFKIYPLNYNFKYVYEKYHKK